MTFSSLIGENPKGKGDFELFESLKKTHEFRHVYQTGISYANKYLVMYVIQNETNRNRLGISVSKKVGNSVIRHRITRLIRESYRLNEDKLLSGYDIIVVARMAAKDKNLKEIQSAFLHLGKLHKIVKEMIES